MVSIAALATIGLAGCGEDTAAPGPTSTTGPSPVATDPPATAAPSTTTSTAATSGDEAEVRAVIDRYWDAWFVAAGNPPDPTNPELNAVLTGDARTRIIGGIEQWSKDGEYVNVPADSAYERTITSVTFDEDGIATVRECIVDDTELVSSVTGEVVDSELTTLKLVTTLRNYPDGWRITTTNTDETITGAASCDNA